MEKMTAFEKRIKNMSAREFEAYAYKEWEKYMNGIKHNDDVIPYSEYYRELAYTLKKSIQS